MRRHPKPCAYCGLQSPQPTIDHVVPRSFYPKSLNNSTVQRITVFACVECNHSFSNDEAHFQHVALLAGQPNDAVHELWAAKMSRALHEVDGGKRLRNILMHTKRLDIGGENRLLIYPAEDQQVMRVVRKVTRGLSAFVGVESAVADDRLRADVLRYELPLDLACRLTSGHAEQDIFRYEHGPLGQGYMWLLTFFNRLTFVAYVKPDG